MAYLQQHYFRFRLDLTISSFIRTVVFATKMRHHKKFTASITRSYIDPKKYRFAFSAQINLNELMIRMRTPKGIQLIPIEASPHYQLALTARSEILPNDVNIHEYFKYVQEFFPERDPHEHFIEKYQTMLTLLDVEQKNISLGIFTDCKKNQSRLNYQIFDGAHRAAILCARDLKTAHCQLVGCKS